MKKYIFIYIFLLGILPLAAQEKVALGEEAEISILVCGPSHDAAFTLYGHAAIRVNDPEKNIDTIFNYGLFDYSSPNFIYRFAKGETDYKLGAVGFLDYMIEYQMRGSYVTELVLNLTTAEKNKIWDALLINYLPQNRVYRYNFFFDNCATRLVDIVEKHIDGQLVFEKDRQEQTFRELINYCTREHHWLTFGCDLALGSPTDRVATVREKMFLPEHLEAAFKTAEIRKADGSSQVLVKKAVRLAEFEPEINNYPPELFTPLICGILIFLLVAYITYQGLRRRKYARGLDVILFTLAGIAGCVLFFISIVSTHPSVFPNLSLVWLHPLHLAGAILIAVKRFGKAANCYHFINFVALTLLLPVWIFFPQHLNVAFIPLIMTLWVRSAFAVYRYKKN